MKNSIRKSAIATLAAGTLLFSGVAASTAAFAQDQVPASVVDANLNGGKGTIHLVKYDDSKGTKDPTGTKDQFADGQTPNPIKGIEFTLTPITAAPGIPSVADAVKSNDKIKELGALQASAAEAALKGGAGWTFGNPIVQKTGENGEINFADLPLGVYLLQETNSKAADGKTYKGAAASLVYLPTTNPKDQSSWIKSEKGDQYAVWVYPKNSLENNVKAVEDTNKEVGETVTYTISATVPTSKKLKTPFEGREYDLNEFGFWDNLDEKLQLLDAKSVKVSVGTDAQKTQLEPADFASTIYKGDGKGVKEDGKDVKATGQELVVALTNSGLDKVAKAKIADSTVKVYLEFSPKVMASGLAPNQAIVVKNNGEGKGTTIPEPTNPPENPDKGEKTNTVVTGWGKIEITKTDGDKKKLKGAEFEVYGITKGGKKEKISINGQDKWTTPDSGVVTIDGLHANNLEDFTKTGESISNDQYKSYELLETKAPVVDGVQYELNRTPIPFTIEVKELTKVTTEETWTLDAQGNVVSKDSAVKTTVESVSTPASDKTLSLFKATEVVNIPVKPKLPLTGGAGIAAFGILGLAVIGGGLYAAKRNEKKNA
ncbi:fimbrial isopeptide formation D2 family protein/LPXTG-motif cell wall-anchored protein [Arcanobacterium wilhelmae]|uniref:Fimbrial isopeptide formation D2 family protein/LPXTG-motif cell wall-anchored protein n=1 Tax=Arcanobacterium wilhelmae TaxID=1803177 RepID=A0ABT9N9T8_9ACTO|nr:SpaH/EbpB family LPXTG-anchored major pilin [Arcanobacterium wilhelmae]MDP9800456.1 fimbrial isopeptide formation D2 family protein/LPXTG-motif cell wall-anchored protein [Arcanobacterium wilhelmae]WFN89876.1 SpaH/EbpB family LPXTG-anchored major pilin [Arcanobacterium wilhelmae]